MHLQILSLIKKVFRKLFRLVSNPIYRRLYKPLGIVELDFNAYPYTDYQKTITTDKDSQYGLYVLFDARIDTDLNTSIAVINRDNMLVSGASWQWQKDRVLQPSQNNIFTKRNFYSNIKKYDSVIFSILSGGAGEYNYFHWLFDCLSRLHLLKLSGLFEQVDLFLVPSLKYSFQRETLLYLGINIEQTIESTTSPNITGKQIIVTNHPVETNIDPLPLWICDFLRNSFLEHGTPSQLKSRRIYINRKDAINNRRILNEDELVTELEKFGFISISATNYSLCEQIGIFANAEVVISAHGAGLANLVFCQKGIKVIEIFNDKFQPKMYEQLSHKRSLRYRKIVAKCVKNKDPDPLYSDILVNTVEVINTFYNLDIKKTV